MMFWKSLLAALFALGLNTAQAQTLTTTNAGPGSAPRIATFCSNSATVTASGTTSVNFGSLSICNASASRVLLISAMGDSATGTSPTTLGVTVNGVSATQAADLALGTSGRLGVYSIAVPAGTTATVVLNLTGGTTTTIFGGVIIWAVDGLSAVASTANNTGTGTAYSVAGNIGGINLVTTKGTNAAANFPSFATCSPAQTQTIGNVSIKRISACVFNPITVNPVTDTINYNGGTVPGFVGASYF